jgi:hypothetical protein
MYVDGEFYAGFCKFGINKELSSEYPLLRRCYLERAFRGPSWFTVHRLPCKMRAGFIMR